MGLWRPRTITWEPYDQGLAVAIDYRFGVPYPDECATGLGFWMPVYDFDVASGTPVALLTNGTVREALGLTSST